ncbi:MAG: NAD(P)H-dependent oxidoreductase subunit E [Bacillota bacterium]|jgi:NADP-reducing hydrogenase subunit HndA
MAKSKTVVPFKGTEEQEAKLHNVLASYKNDNSALVPILQEAQDIYGYLPIEVQTIIADDLGISLSEVYSTVSFYAQFTLNPRGKYHIAVCMGTACYVRGAGDIVEKVSEMLDVEEGATSENGLYTLEATRCIGACGLAPVLTINGDVYGRLVLDDIPGILEKYQS